MYNTLVQFFNLLDQHTAVINLVFTSRKGAYSLVFSVVNINLDFLSIQQSEQDNA